MAVWNMVEPRRRCVLVRVLLVDPSRRFCDDVQYLQWISEKRKEKIEKSHLEWNKIITLETELLIRHEISKELYLPFSKIDFGYGPYGKPFVSGVPNYYFSVSHTGNCIVFVSARTRIGIDVEEISNAPFAVARRFFAAGEYRFIQESRNAERAFYKVWTSKEAYLKMLGTGLSLPLDSFDVTKRSSHYYLSSHHFKKYIVTVCTEENSVIRLDYIKDERYENH